MIMEDKSSIIWSTFIQRPETLYQTRAIRFRDENRQHFLEAMSLKDGMNILEVGCGPGALCHALERWLPHSRITGLDRDSVFIKYAAEKSKELHSKCNFIIGDATNLQFPDNTFDVAASHTVIEHIEPTRFLSEQYRVLKPGGICTVLSVRTGISLNYDPWKNNPDEEKTLMQKVEPYFKASDQKYDVAKYAINETELPKKMMETGFHNISIHFLVLTAIPDSADVNAVLAKTIIEGGRQIALDAVEIAQAITAGVLSDAEIERLKWLINTRFDQRIRLYETGQKIWDVSASVIMVGRGIK